MLANLGLDPVVKWPNDILVNKQKIAGILIQNKLKEDVVTHSVIGIGLNINQLSFGEYLPKATSLQLLLNKKFDLAIIANELLRFFAKRLEIFKSGNNQEKEYLSSLYLKDKVATFESNNQKFMGIIKGVSQSGKLLIQLEDDSIAKFENQEVKFLF